MQTLKSKKTKKKFVRTTLKSIWMSFSIAFMVSHLALPQSVEQISIMAWEGIPPDESTVERYVELRESGITHNLTLFSNVEELAVAMDAAAKVGIKMLVKCPELKTETEKIVKRFMNHPAIAGYCLLDEPNRSQFPALGEWVRKIQAIDDKHFCYVNLLPNTAAKDPYLGTETYLEHVQLFIKEVPVQLLTFDHYPIFVDPSGQRVLREMWYENLEIISDEACKAGKPFWAFALTVAHTTRTLGQYPIPTIADIRLQVYSNLAYGAQGIQYFTYWTPKQSVSHGYHHAPIDSITRKRTEVYDYIKEINTEIKNLSFVFLNAKVVSVAHTGKTIPRGTKRLSKLPDVIKTFETEGPAGAVVSVLEKDGKSYLVVVNRDFKNNLKVKIEGDPGLQRILKDGSMVPASAYISTMTVAPGDILIYCWNN